MIGDPTLAPERSRDEFDETRASPEMQNCGFLLELSPDWIILRASENTHAFLSEYPARLIGEPLARFTRAQPLHDLRNSLARQRSSSGISRAYRVRLLDDPRHFDFAFQTRNGKFQLEGVISPDEGVGEWLGAVSRVIDGMESGSGEEAAADAARRVRALSGFDRVSVFVAGKRGRIGADSNRGNFSPHPRDGDLDEHFPPILSDSSDRPVGLVPRKDESGILEALLASPSDEQRRRLCERGVGSMLSVPILRNGETIGGFICESRKPRAPSFELHAAVELFAQIFAARLNY